MLKRKLQLYSIVHLDSDNMRNTSSQKKLYNSSSRGSKSQLPSLRGRYSDRGDPEITTLIAQAHNDGWGEVGLPRPLRGLAMTMIWDTYLP